MTVESTWLEHLLELVRQEGGGRKGYREVALKTGLSEEYVYQLCEAKPHADGTRRLPGRTAARRIAKAYAEGRPLDWINAPLSGAVLMTREPSPWTLEGVLRQLGSALAQVAPGQRKMVAGLLEDWALDGGADHYVEPLLAALQASSGKRHQLAK